MACGKTKFFQVGSTPVWRVVPYSAFFYVSGMSIDADGGYHAYHPDPHKGLDYLANAGKNGNWWGVVTDTGEKDGTPIVQGPNDPAPGYFVSTTALNDHTLKQRDPRRYVNAEKIPYIALPKGHAGGARLGDFAMVFNRANQRTAGAIYADVGPADEIGEGSIALAEALGIDSDPKHGGTQSGVVYAVFPGSGNGQPRPVSDIQTESQKQFAFCGGVNRILDCIG